MSTNYYQEKITSFPGGLTRTIRSAPLANVAKFRAEAGDISVFDVYTDFVSAGAQQFTLKINGVDQIPVAGNRPDLNGVDHDTWTPAAPIAVNDGDIISVDLTAVGGAGVNAPLYIRIGIDVAGAAANLDDLADVDAAAPADGDVLTFDNGSGDWIPSAPAGGSSALGIFSPDVPYVTPNAIDDEFDAGSLDVKWTAIGAAPTQNWDIPNHIGLTGTDASNPGGFIQAVSAADITFIAKIIPPNGDASNVGNTVGLVVKNAIGRHDGFHIVNSNGNNGAYIRWNTWTTFNAAGDQGSAIQQYRYDPLFTDKVYLKVQYTHSGTLLQVFASANGITWNRIVNSTTFGSAAISHIGFFVYGNTSQVGLIDWFRVLQGDYTGGNI